MGASAGNNGESGLHSHMTNTLNTPVEALENSYPLLVEEYSLRKNSGGAGKHRGGDGLIRQIRLLSDAQVTILSERRNRQPYGLAGGKPGKTGENLIASDGQKFEKAPGKFVRDLKKGTSLRIKTPGGGGYGREK